MDPLREHFLTFSYLNLKMTFGVCNKSGQPISDFPVWSCGPRSPPSRWFSTASPHAPCRVCFSLPPLCLPFTRLHVCQTLYASRFLVCRRSWKSWWRRSTLASTARTKAARAKQLRANRALQPRRSRRPPNPKKKSNVWENLLLSDRLGWHPQPCV